MMYSFTCSQISLLVLKDVFALIFGLVILPFSTCQNNLINVSHIFNSKWTRLVYFHLKELRQQYGVEKGLLPEHPRAGSTDDVEGIFSFLHGLLGPIFVFPKVISEYTKKCDPDLPFYYLLAQTTATTMVH